MAKETTTLERLIWLSWRAFWIGLGASGVLIVQALAARGAVAPAVHEIARAAPVRASAAPSPPGRPRSADPILMRNPFESSGPRLAPQQAPSPTLPQAVPKAPTRLL